MPTPSSPPPGVPPSTAPSAGAWAEVRARDHVVRYRRWGMGSATVVLLGPDATEAPMAAIVPALLAGGRLLQPQLGVDEPGSAARLLAFLEGIGATEVALVAADPFCGTALELALVDGGPLTAVVLLRGEQADGPDLDGVLTAPGGRWATPVLVVRGVPGEGNVATGIARFVRGERRPA